jgi:hypothetical protein
LLRASQSATEGQSEEDGVGLQEELVAPRQMMGRTEIENRK